MRAQIFAAAVFCCLGAACASLFDTPVFLGNGRSPPWWSVTRESVPRLAAKAAQLEGIMSDSTAFSQLVLGMLGAANGDAAVARTLGFMLNHNLTFGGGCPVPPHAAAFNTLVPARLLSSTELSLGEGMAATLLATRGDNDTAAAAQALLGAFFAAGRTCGPPNALSSHSANETRAKYLASTCYFIGPVIMAPMRNPAFQATLRQVAAAQLAKDSWGSGALLGAMQDCAAGGARTQRPPAWLYQGFGPLAPVAAPAAVGTPFLAPAWQAGAAVAGRRLRYAPHA